MKKIILFISIIICLFSCAKFLKPKNMKYIYDNNYAGIDTLLFIDGYYIAKDSRGNYSALMLYRDGSIAYPLRNVYHSQKEIEENFVDYKTSKAKNFNTYWGGWGIYKVINDTIFAQTTLWYDRITRMRTQESVLLIKSKNEIELIKGWFKEDRSSYSFIPYSNRIDSTNWLLDKKWFYKKD